MDTSIERMCPYCHEPIPEGVHGRFCSNEHEWLYRQRQQPQQPPRRINGHDHLADVREKAH